MPEKDPVYVVAGDEMCKLMRRASPEAEIVPFREDLSRGDPSGFSFSPEFVAARAAFWSVPAEDYLRHMAPVTGLDLSRDLVLCFGEDDCCRANLAFLLGYLRGRGYARPVTVRIVDERDLRLIREYVV